MIVVVIMWMRMIVVVGMPIGAVRMSTRHCVAGVLIIRAAAGGAHHATSISLILSSSPAMTRSFALPQTQRPKLSQRYLMAAVSAQRASGRLDDVQCGALDHGVPGADIEAEAHRIRHHRGQLADLQPHAHHACSPARSAQISTIAVGDAQFVHRSHPSRSSAIARRPACRRCARRRTRFASPPCRPGRSVTSPMTAARRRPDAHASRSARDRHRSPATTATSLPSLARYSGSRPKDFAGALDLLAHRQRAFADTDPDIELLRELVQHGRNAAARRVAQAVDDGTRASIVATSPCSGWQSLSTSASSANWLRAIRMAVP